MKKCRKCGNIFKSDLRECPTCGTITKTVEGITALCFDQSNNGNGFDTKFYNILFAIENKHFWFRARNRIIIWALKRFFSSTVHFIEIGCGTGYVLEAIRKALPEAEISGSDLFREALFFTKKRVPTAALFQMDATDIPFENEYDVIGAFDVLEHIDNDQKVLHCFNNALNDSGGIILTVPQHPFLWSNYDTQSCHVRRYTRKELLEKVKRAGFDIVFASSFVSFLFPFLLISRKKTRTSMDNLISFESNKIAAILNFVFELIMTAELLFIRIGVALPFGGSLLLIGKKRNLLVKKS